MILASGYAEPAMLAWARIANGDSAAGETSRAATQGMPAERRVSFLSKPFTPRQLAREVRRVLDAAHRGQVSDS
jgi:phage tail tape-measure protein